MLEVLIMVAIFSAILLYFEKPIIEDIKNSKTAEEAIANRKKLKKYRYTLLGIFLIVYFGGSIYLNSLLDSNWYTNPECYKSIILAFIWTFMELAKKSSHSPLCKVSTISKDDVLKTEQDFILYLRGFENDNYESISELRNKIEFDTFSEFHFIREIANYMPVYAVGMTKEIECPRGAERIYLCDATWKEDVRELMEKARFIVILVDNKVNCIWEIEQSKSMLSKTLFVVDDVTKHFDAKEILKDKLILPDIQESQTYYIKQNDIWNIVGFKNNVGSYKRMAESIISTQTGYQKGYFPSWRKKLLIGIVIFLISFAVSVLIGSVCDMKAPGVLILLFMPLGFVVYKKIVTNKKNLIKPKNFNIKTQFLSLPKFIGYGAVTSIVINMLLLFGPFMHGLFISDPCFIYYENLTISIVLLISFIISVFLICGNKISLFSLLIIGVLEIIYGLASGGDGATMCCIISGIINILIVGLFCQDYYMKKSLTQKFNMCNPISISSILATIFVIVLMVVIPFVAGNANGTNLQYYKCLRGMKELNALEYWDNSYYYEQIAEDYADEENEDDAFDYFMKDEEKSVFYYKEALKCDYCNRDKIFIYLARYYGSIDNHTESVMWYKKYLDLLNDGYDYLEFESEAKNNSRQP